MIAREDSARVLHPVAAAAAVCDIPLALCGRKNASPRSLLCIPDNRYLVFIELVARVRISCGARARVGALYRRHFSPSPRHFSTDF